MSLKRKAVEGIVVASSLAMMCSIAETAGMVVVEAAPVTVDAETDLEAKRTAGVILYLDLVKAEVLSSLEEAADVSHVPANLVSSAENAQIAEAEEVQPEKADPAGEEVSLINVFAGASEVLAGISEQYSTEEATERLAEDSLEGEMAGAAAGEEVSAESGSDGSLLEKIGEDFAELTDENREIEDYLTIEGGQQAEGTTDTVDRTPKAGNEAETQLVPGTENGTETQSVPGTENGTETQPATGTENGTETQPASGAENGSEVRDVEGTQAVEGTEVDVEFSDATESENGAASGAEEDFAADQAIEQQAEWQNRLMADVNDFLYVRSEGSTEAEVVGKMYKGDVAEIVEVGESWTHVVSGNVDGYVLNDYCVLGQQALEYASANFDTQAEIQTDGLRVRSDADAESTVLTSVSSGTTLTVDTSVVTNEEWVAVKYEGTTAYVSADYVKTQFALGEAVTIEEERAAAAAAAAAKAAEEAAAAKAAQTKQTQTVQKSSVSASMDDVTLLAALIQCEAGSESYEGQLAVGAVVMNRVRSGAYPGSVYGVIYESGQFTPAGTGAVASVAASGPKGSCIQAAQQALGGADNTGGATSFRRVSSGQSGVVIGNHVFF